VSIDAQIAHSERRARESEKVAERVERDLERHSASLEQLEEASVDIEKLMDDAKGERNKGRIADDREATSEVGGVWQGSDQRAARSIPPTVSNKQGPPADVSRATANASNVAERQQAETTRRDRKTQMNAVHSAEDRIQQAEARRDSITEEVDQLGQRRQSVSSTSHPFSQSDARALQRDGF